MALLKPIDHLFGVRFGHLTILGEAPRGKRYERRVLVRCDCGSEQDASLPNIQRGLKSSCGKCEFRSHAHARAATTHGCSGQKMPEYTAWGSMLTRCRNPNATGYEHYGGRGIRVCDRWLDFEAFLQDMGPRPSRIHSIDRVDVNGDYELSNCRWADIVTQARNHRNNRIIDLNGESKTVAEWAEVTGLSSSVLLYRLKKGWSPSQVILTPLMESKSAGHRGAESRWSKRKLKDG